MSALIRVEHVHRRVMAAGRTVEILTDVSFAVPTGQFVSIVGASGSGKSTLLGLMAGLDAVTSGRIWLADHEITGLSEGRLAELRGREIGFVFQAYHLIANLTAEENAALPLELLGKRNARFTARALLERVGLSHRLKHYPAQLSGGEQQRVAIARAFAGSPKLLLADEPTGNLDSTTGAQVIELLAEFNATAGTTMIMATHDLNLAARADRQIELRDGRIVRDDHPYEPAGSPPSLGPDDPPHPTDEAPDRG